MPDGRKWGWHPGTAPPAPPDCEDLGPLSTVLALSARAVAIGQVDAPAHPISSPAKWGLGHLREAGEPREAERRIVGRQECSPVAMVVPGRKPSRRWRVSTGGPSWGQVSPASYTGSGCEVRTRGHQDDVTG